MIPPDTIQVIIPALDEEATIGRVVADLRAAGLTRIRVVDNGSRDRTAERARAAGAEVVTETRRGYGQACWTGSQGLAPEIAWLLFADADGSDDPADVARLLAAAADGADFVLGDRRATPAGRAVMTPVQRFGNALATTLIRLGWGQRYRDLGPFRLIRRALYERIAMRDRGFGWTIEMQVRAAELGARIVELPVAYRRRAGGRSKISGTVRGSVQAGTIILSTLARLAWRQADVRALAAALLVLAGAALMASFGAMRAADVPWLLAAAGVMGAGFALVWKPARVAPWLFWAAALGARALLLPMEPGDDVWRYLWEGRVQGAGFSPYVHAPADPALAALRTEWWPLINHPGATAIYPPPLLLFFRGLAALAGDGVLAWKLVFVAAELITCGWLARRFGHARAALFAWNPLLLYTTAGGAHFESLLLLALVAAWAAWEAGRWGRAALALGLSIGVKWVTVPLLVWMVWQRRREPRVALGILALGAVPVLAALAWFRVVHGPLGPLAPAEFVAKARHLDLLPWLVDLVRQPTRAEIHNGWIKWLFLPLAGGVLLAARRFVTAAEAYFLVLLACLPSVHAWYFVWLAPWLVPTGHLGARLVSIGGFAYFWVWRTHELTGRWETSALERGLVWAPLVLGAGYALVRARRV